MTAILRSFDGVSPATTLAERIGTVVQWVGSVIIVHWTVPMAFMGGMLILQDRHCPRVCRPQQMEA